MPVLKRVALYARVSTEEQAEAGYSIEAQGAALRECVQKEGKLVYQVYTDAGVSGVKEDRKALNALLDDARKKRFSEVLV